MEQASVKLAEKQDSTTTKMNDSTELLKPETSVFPDSDKSIMKKSAVQELKTSSSTSLNDSHLREKASSATQFAVDSQFFNTMKFDFRKEYSNIPAHSIFPLLLGKDIDRLRKELTFLGPKELFKRDEEFRSPLHLAVAANTSVAPLVVTTLFSCFFDLSAARFASDISVFEYEKHNSISVAMSVSSQSAAITRSPSRTPKDSINQWFAQESKRAYTQALIRNEWFWAQMLMMEDLEGRTPLHYAIASHCSIDTLKALMYATVNGRAQLHAVFPKSAGWNAAVFESEVMYDSLTGHAIVATLEGGFKSVNIHASIDVIAATAKKKKSRTVQSTNADMSDDEDLSASMLLMGMDADSKTEVHGNVGIRRERVGRRSRDVELDYDTIVPWLLANIELQCRAKGAKFEISGAEMLEEVVMDYNRALEDVVRDAENRRKHGNRSPPRSRSSRQDHDDADIVLLPSEFVAILEMFGIRVVEEVVREVCRRYFADKDAIDDRVAFVNKHRELLNRQLKRADKRKDRELSRRVKRDGNHDAKGAESSSGSKDSLGRSGSTDQYSDDDDDDGFSSDSEDSSDGDYDDYPSRRAHSKYSGDHDRAGEKGNSSGSASRRSAKNKHIKRSAKIALVSQEEAIFGIDMVKLLRDFKNGHAFVKIPAVTGTSSDNARSHQPDIDQSSSRLASLRRRNNLSDEAMVSSQKVGDEILKAVLVYHGTAGTTRHMNAIVSPQKRSVDIDTTRIRYSAFPASISRSLLDSLAYQVMNAQDSYGRTALMLSSALGYKDHVSALLERCYDLSNMEVVEGKFRGSSGNDSTAVVDLAIMTNSGYTAISLASTQSISSMLQQRLVGWLTESRREVSGVHSGSVDTSQSSDKTKALKQLAPQLERLQKSNWQYSRVPLSWAVLNGLPDAVEHMLSLHGDRSNNGVIVTETDALGRTPLHECMTLVSPSSESSSFASKALEIAELLYTAGADLDARSISGKTPLHEMFCSNSGGPMLSLGNGVNSEKDAIAESRRALLKAMLQWGANPTIQDYHGSSGGWAPIHYCCRSNTYVNCMLEFLRASVVGATSTTPIQYTSTKLLQNCLHIACANGCDKMAHILVRWDIDSELIYRIYQPNGAPGAFNDNYEVTVGGRGSSNSGSCCSGGNRLASSKRAAIDAKGLYSLMSGRDINNKLPKNLMRHTMSKRTLDTLWLACYMGNSGKVAETLREYKMNSVRTRRSVCSLGTDFWLENSIDCKTPHLKLTPMHCAIIGWAVHEAFNGTNSPARQCLRIKGSPPAGKGSARNRRDGASIVGNENGKHAEVLQLLLNNYGYVDAVDRHGRTPLMIASAANLPVAINMLLSNRANIAVAEVKNVAQSRLRSNRTALENPATKEDVDANANNIDDDDDGTFDDLDDVAASIHITDIDGNCCLHYAYASGAAAAITVLEAALLKSNRRVKEVLNFKQESPVDCAGKISYMKAILPKVCNFYMTPSIVRHSCDDYVSPKSPEVNKSDVTHIKVVPSSSKIDFDDL